MHRTWIRMMLRGVCLSVAATLAVFAQTLPPAHTISVQVNALKEVDAFLAQGIIMSGREGLTIVLEARDSDLRWLEQQGYAWEAVYTGPPMPIRKTLLNPLQLGVYHKHVDITAFLQHYANTYPDIARLENVGNSVQGRALWALRISDNPDLQEDEPEFKYISSMHGDEVMGIEMCLYLIDLLLTGYNIDQRMTDLVNETEIWIMPLMNPDGREVPQRYNANGKDLNRNFPIFPTQYAGTIFEGEGLHTAGRQVETQRVMEWTAANSFVLSANFHGGALLVNYPYDFREDVPNGSYAEAPDDALLRYLSLTYSMHNTPMFNSPVFEDGITNGSDWFFVADGMQDWNYRYAGCIEVTLEISTAKTPAESLIPNFWEDNRESMLAYMEQVHIGVRGLVTDAVTNAPIYAQINVAFNEQPAFTDPDVGDYHRLLLPGTYLVGAIAPGYVPRWTFPVEVAEGPATRLDLALSRGDVNGDGKVDAADIQRLVNGALGEGCVGDCNPDGLGGTSSSDVNAVIDLVLARS